LCNISTKEVLESQKCGLKRNYALQCFRGEKLKYKKLKIVLALFNAFKRTIRGKVAFEDGTDIIRVKFLVN